MDRQLPEPLLSQKRERDEKYKEIKHENAEISEDKKDKRKQVHIKNKILYINNVPQKQYITPPNLPEVLNISTLDQQRMEKIQLQVTESVSEKGSTFRGFATTVKSVPEIRLAYRRIKALYPECDHVVMAYRLKSYTGNQDDGEYGASKRLLQMLTEGKCKNTVLFVAKEYGGIHLGQRRFIRIEKVAKEASAKLVVP